MYLYPGKVYTLGVTSNLTFFVPKKAEQPHQPHICAPFPWCKRERERGRERAGKQNFAAEFAQEHLKINDRLDATTYEGGGGDDSRRFNFRAVGLELVGRVAVLVPEAN